MLDPTFVIGPGIDINNISVSVGITEDILIEGQERFEVILSLPPGGTVRVGSINKTTVKIDDNDGKLKLACYITCFLCMSTSVVCSCY